MGSFCHFYNGFFNYTFVIWAALQTPGERKHNFLPVLWFLQVPPRPPQTGLKYSYQLQIKQCSSAQGSQLGESAGCLGLKGFPGSRESLPKDSRKTSCEPLALLCDVWWQQGWTSGFSLGTYRSQIQFSNGCLCQPRQNKPTAITKHQLVQGKELGIKSYNG